MSKSFNFKYWLIGFAVILVLSLGIGFIEGVLGVNFGTSSYTFPVVFGILVSLVLQNLSGNRKEQRADDSSRQAALQGVAPAGQAIMYVYREGFVGRAIGFDVSLDASLLSQLRSPRFTQTAIWPGVHNLTVKGAGQFKTGEITFEARTGEMIVFAIKSRMGAATSALYFVRELDAQAALRKLAKIPMVAVEQRAPATAPESRQAV